jgi:hypothetical protein
LLCCISDLAVNVGYSTEERNRVLSVGCLDDFRNIHEYFFDFHDEARMTSERCPSAKAEEQAERYRALARRREGRDRVFSGNAGVV